MGCEMRLRVYIWSLRHNGNKNMRGSRRKIEATKWRGFRPWKQWRITSCAWEDEKWPWGCRKDRQQQQINLRIYFGHWWQPQILAVSSKFQMEKKKRQELYNSRHNKIFSEKSPHPSPRSWEKHCEGVLIVWRDPEGRQEVLCKALQPGDLSRALVYKTETSPGAISLSQPASRNQKAV